VRKAVVDVGSNSVLLLVEESDGDAWRFVADGTCVSSLGENTKATGVLGEKGMVATLEALRIFFDRAAELGSQSTEAYATMAARIASNTGEFQARAAMQRTPVSILSGEREARLGFESVAYDSKFATESRISIIDIGGQSTELTTAVRQPDGWHIEFERSFAIGTLALRGGLLNAESPDPRALIQASAEIDDLVGMSYLRGSVGLAVVLGATGTNLVTIRDGMRTWQPEVVHGAYLDFEEISGAVGRLSRMTDAERAALVGIEPGREGTLHLGALILERFLNAIGAPGCAVSVRGWRHALLERGLPEAT
jgi:exopolyphosphatase/guanosine-5'-triphosphate,3'-diphosphate pyrophosphatase